MLYQDTLPQSNHHEYTLNTVSHLSQVVHELTGIIHNLASKVDVLCSRLGSHFLPSNGENRHSFEDGISPLNLRIDMRTPIPIHDSGVSPYS